METTKTLKVGIFRFYEFFSKRRIVIERDKIVLNVYLPHTPYLISERSPFAHDDFYWRNVPRSF